MKLPEVGTIFQSKYRLDGVLGSGGFATVFKATDVAAGRTVALKVLTPLDRGYAATVQSRFAREVRVVANLRDPHTIKLFDSGTSADGLLFMVTEYVPGEDLLELLKRRGRLEPVEVVHIVRQVLMSLREAHAAGLLHRDIKPANIRVFEYMGDALRVKVLDFGIAKPVHNDKEGITAAGELVGTLRYMSPEQLLSADLTPSSDIYSLGVVAFEMLLGTSGIHGTRLSDQMDRLLTGHVFSIPELERIGPELCRVLDQMAARDERQRYHSVDEVLAALQHIPGARLGPSPQSWSGPISQFHRSDELLPPPNTGPYPAPNVGHSRAFVPSTESMEIPRPVPVTDPGFELRRPVNSNRRILNVAIALAVAVVVLGGALAVILAEGYDEPEPVASAGTRRVVSYVKGAEPEPEPEPEPPPSFVEEANPTEEFTNGTPGCGQIAAFAGLGEVRAGARSWPAFLPADYDGKKPRPLLIILHENAEQPAGFLRYSGFMDVADEAGFVIIAPSGGFPLAWTTPDSVEQVRLALTDAQEELCIDRDRVFAVGHGAGGKVVERIRCDLPEVRAIASTSFRSEVGNVVCKAKKPIPYLHVAPLNDGYNPVEGGESCSKAMKISLVQKERIWRKNQQCGATETTWLDQGKDSCKQWNCKADFVLCRVAGGRRWPGQEVRIWDNLSGNNCDGPPSKFDYANVIWKFFDQYRTVSDEPSIGR